MFQFTIAFFKVHETSDHLNENIQIEATVVNEEGRTKTTIDSSIVITSQPIKLKFIKPPKTYTPNIKTRFTVSNFFFKLMFQKRKFCLLQVLAVYANEMLAKNVTMDVTLNINDDQFTVKVSLTMLCF